MMAQPDSNTVHQALVGSTNESALLPNVLAPDQPQLPQLVQQLIQQNAQIHQTLAQINLTLGQTHQTLAQTNLALGRINQRLQNMEDLLPIRLYNAPSSLDNPLQYPAGIVVAPPFPYTKSELLELTVAQCNIVAGALGLAQLGPGATAAECRQQISDYLGCGMKFRDFDEV